MTPPVPTRALIVEDDPVVARSVARRLLREGYTVSLAGTCRAARVAGTGFQVAILDLDLPDGSGADLADELLRMDAVLHVVFYTGSMDQALLARASRFGSVVDKGQSVDEVVAALQPFASARVSHLAPAVRPRSRVSGARFVRVGIDDDVVTESAAEVRSSRR